MRNRYPTHGRHITPRGHIQEPLRVAKCEIVNMEVPANAEIVLEGMIHPDDLIEDAGACPTRTREKCAGRSCRGSPGSLAGPRQGFREHSPSMNPCRFFSAIIRTFRVF